MKDFYEIENRRYIGNKSKLNNWIMQIILDETKTANSFCDLFSGTGTVANQAFNYFNKVIINDFLYSNRVIYGAFFEKGEYDIDKLKKIIDIFNEASIETNNWFSDNYGDRYFSMSIAKKIGYVREQIEINRENLTPKEYNILLSSLIYSIDKHANTVGHFDAFIKKNIKATEFKIKLISVKSFDNVEIYREDANILVKNIIADVVYIDPPYNSRQYSRFYHIYETLIKWDKPQLFGVALKPRPENMSNYCKSSAFKSFQDLICNINAKYIVVSYNNTYTSKSNSSKNKITLEQISYELKKRGETKVFMQKYNAFNTGKTFLENHKEYLFLTKTNN